jgi:dihydroorotate dehydrogenase (fumarate)
MDLTTPYLGFTLAHPIVPGASPLADELDTVRQLEDAGAPAIVLRSLFEEQIVLEQMAEHVHLDGHADSSAEAASYFPDPHAFVLGTDAYLNHLRKVKAAVGVPVIASLNGTTPGGWLEFAALLQQAGADALELNVYHVPTDPSRSGADLERQTLEIVQGVKRVVTIPVAVKLSPFYSAFAHFGCELDRAGADALVIFNRFYQPDIDPAELQLSSELHLSTSSELLMRLHWTAILAGRVRAALAITGGVHTSIDVVKATMAGAQVTQVVSTLLRHGPARLRAMVGGLKAWMREHEWYSLGEMRGNMSLERVPDPGAYERGNYMRMLQGWHT